MTPEVEAALAWVERRMPFSYVGETEEYVNVIAAEVRAQQARRCGTCAFQILRPTHLCRLLERECNDMGWTCGRWKFNA